MMRPEIGIPYSHRVQIHTPQPRTMGLGGSLTVYDTEESPLSTMQTVRRKSEAREGRQCSRNEPGQAHDEPEKGRFPGYGWNEHPRWSKSKQIRMASAGSGRMLS